MTATPDRTGLSLKDAGLFIKPHEKKWWKSAVVYQIYPASYKDSNGDGLGDLPGITSKLDYLKNLGIDVVWLSPIFESPLVDMGYDISNYKKIDPRYGSNEDLLTLISELHKRGMKLLLDLVVNHTSDKHPWFEESKSLKPDAGGKRDWYIWKKGKKNEKTGELEEPNNWSACFGGSAWHKADDSDEYYLHLFCPEQPDLNWENPEVRNAVWDVMHFWLKQGVDGFRMDVINMISKYWDFPDAPIQDPTQKFHFPKDTITNGPKMHDYLKEMNERVISHYDMMNVGEMPNTHTASKVLEYVHKDRNELQMVFDFVLVDLDHETERKTWKPRDWTLSEFKEIVARWATGLYDGGWAAVYMENHDQCRSVSRFANDSPEYRWLSSKMLGLLEMTSFGTPYVYQGQEIGQINLPEEYPIEEFLDVQSVNRFQAIRDAGHEAATEAEEIKWARWRGRDNARAPMQWDATKYAGFTDAESSTRPWMLPSPDAKICNAEVQVSDKDSVYNWWKRLIALRKEKEVLIYGRFELVSSFNEDIFAYLRTVKKEGSEDDLETVLVVLNFSDKQVKYDVPVGEHPLVGDLTKAKAIMNTYEVVQGDKQLGFKDDSITLEPYQGILFSLQQ